MLLPFLPVHALAPCERTAAVVVALIIAVVCTARYPQHSCSCCSPNTPASEIRCCHSAMATDFRCRYYQANTLVKFLGCAKASKMVGKLDNGETIRVRWQQRKGLKLRLTNVKKA